MSRIGIQPDFKEALVWKDGSGGGKLLFIRHALDLGDQIARVGVESIFKLALPDKWKSGEAHEKDERNDKKPGIAVPSPNPAVDCGRRRWSNLGIHGF